MEIETQFEHFCPICDSSVELKKEKVNKSFRGNSYDVVEHRYVCVSCHFEFTDSNLDRLNVEQVYNLYRSQHNIPFPEEIKELREKYELSQKKMSELLGLGTNMYRKYELGEIPSKSNGLLIRDLMDVQSFEKHIFKMKDHLKPKELLRIREIVFQDIFGNEKEEEIINEFTGFQKKSYPKIGALMIFFLENFQYSYKTKLNKLFFYTDFYHFKKNGKSISGLCYEAIDFGPVPQNYTSTYGELEKLGYIKIGFETFNTDVIDKFERIGSFSKDEFTIEEQSTLTTILDKFKAMKRDEIVAISHLENAWIENREKRNLISFTKHAFDLKAV